MPSSQVCGLTGELAARIENRLPHFQSNNKTSLISWILSNFCLNCPLSTLPSLGLQAAQSIFRSKQTRSSGLSLADQRRWSNCLSTSAGHHHLFRWDSRYQEQHKWIEIIRKIISVSFYKTFYKASYRAAFLFSPFVTFRRRASLRSSFQGG